jgi:hypothetical protein
LGDAGAVSTESDHEAAALLLALVEAIAFLKDWNKAHWVEWLEADAARIRRGDAYGVDHLLGAFGGIGSLNDLVITQMNGDDVAEADVPGVNERLDDLRDRVWRHAQALRHAAREP